MRPDLFIKILTPLELVCYGILIVDRIKAITAIYEVNEGLRQLITFYDYESGWNLVFLAIAVVGCLLTFVKKKVAWILRQIGLISLTISFLLMLKYVAVVTLLIGAVYWHPKIMKYFRIVDEKRKHYLIAACSALVLVILGQSVEIISY